MAGRCIGGPRERRAGPGEEGRELERAGPGEGGRLAAGGTAWLGRAGGGGPLVLTLARRCGARWHGEALVLAQWDFVLACSGGTVGVLCWRVVGHWA